MPKTSWLMKMPYRYECSECHKHKIYFKVRGTECVINEVVKCWDCFMKECREAEGLRQATEQEA